MNGGRDTTPASTTAAHHRRHRGRPSPSPIAIAAALWMLLHPRPVARIAYVHLHLVSLDWHVADADAMLRTEMLRNDERRLVLLPVAMAGVR